MNMLNCDCVVLDQHYEHAELWLCCTWSTLWTCWTVTVLYLINTMNMLNCDCVVLDQHYEHAELWLCCTWSTLWTCWTVTVLYLINTMNMLNCDCVVLDQHYEHAELWLCCTWSTLCLFSFGHCIVYLVIYRFWLLLWYLRFTDSDYFFGILDLRILITSLVS